MSPLHMAFGVLVAIIWGGNFVGVKYGLMHFPSFLFTFMRFALAALLLVPFLRPLSQKQYGIMLLIGLFSALHFAFFFLALEKGLSIAGVAVVAQSGVPFACVLSALFLGDRMGLWRSAGVMISFVGLMIVAGAPDILSHLDAFFVMLVCAFFWAVSTLFIKKVSDIPSMTMLGWLCVFTLPFGALLTAVIEDIPADIVFTAPLESWAGLFYTSVLSTIVAYGLWCFLLSRHPISQVTPFSLLSPVFGIAFGQLFFQEALSVYTLVGGIVTFIGVAIIVYRRPKHAIVGEAS